MAEKFWTEERADRLEVLWHEGTLSASGIAKELGCTRNAVIGKANRMELAYREPCGRKLTADAVREIRRARRKRGDTPKWAAKLGVTRSAIDHVLHDRTWRGVRA